MTEEIPAYSLDALQARDIFFEGIARVHFFVEDEHLENLYECLLERIFPRLDSFAVFALAGKDNVLRHARSNDANEHKALRIYILDKDFDDVLGKIFVRDDVFYLDDYNIEMSLLDEVSLLRICVEERPRVRRAVLRERFGFDTAMQQWLPMLDKLHRAFALVQKYDLGIANSNLPPERFTKPGDVSSLDGDVIDRYVSDVANALVLRDVIVDRDDYDGLSNRIFIDRRYRIRHINGKFVARLCYHRMKRRQLLSNVTQDSIVMRCAGGSELKRLRGFKLRVGRFLKQHGF